jgi:hypothetical protein
VRLDDMNRRFRNRKVLEVGYAIGLEAPGDQSEFVIRDQPLELRQDQRMAPIETDRGKTLGSHRFGG